MKRMDTGFPWGQIGLYQAILFWLVGIMSGTILAYDVAGIGIWAVLCVALFAGSVTCGGIGLFKAGFGNKCLGSIALAMTLIPVAVMMLKG